MRQDIQDKLIEKCFKKSVELGEVGPGAVFAIKNNFRDICHPPEIVGVYLWPKMHDGLGCTFSGGLTQASGTEYWLPVDISGVKFQKG